MIGIVVAIGEGGVIGKDNKLPWPMIKEDMKFFRETTSGGTVIMGRKTYKSIGRPLPNRRNIVISRQNFENTDKVEYFKSLQEAIKATSKDEKVFIIGGGEIYAEAIRLDIVEKMFITHVLHEYEGDCFFKHELSDSWWGIVNEKRFARGEEFEHPFKIVEYQRIA